MAVTMEILDIAKKVGVSPEMITIVYADSDIAMTVNQSTQATVKVGQRL